jgi:hypothetical protein
MITLMLCVSGLAFGQSAWFLEIYDNGGANMVEIEETTTTGATVINSSGTFTDTVVAGAAGSGQITFVGTIGNWVTNTAAGLASPALPSGNMSLASTSNVNSTSDNLSIYYMEVGLTTLYSGWDVGLTGNLVEPGGFATGTASVSNVTTPPPLTGSILCTTGELTPGLDVATGCSGSLPLTVTSPYTLTDQINFFTPGGSGNFNATSDVTPVPEPASIALFGSGLLSLAGFARRRFVK